MELLGIMRLLWRRRLPVAAGIVVAIAVGIGIGMPPPTSSAVAWTRVALDTPTSQLVKSAPAGADTLPWRASFLSHLMATDSTQRELARRLGVRPDQVIVIDAALATPLVAASMPDKAAKAASVTGAPYVLTVQLQDAWLPVISVEAAAPDAAGAKRLADAGIAVLSSETSSDGSYASIIETGAGALPRFQPFVVQQVAPVRVRSITTAVLPMKALAASIFVLGLWFAATLLASRLVRRRPRAARTA